MPRKDLGTLAAVEGGGGGGGDRAGVSEILIMYPLDVIKTRAQLQIGGTRIRCCRGRSELAAAGVFFLCQRRRFLQEEWAWRQRSFT